MKSPASALEFELKLAGIRCEPVRIEADLVRVGSAAHCELRLPADQAAPEHLRIEQRREGVFVEVRAPGHGLTLEGRPWEGGLLTTPAALAWSGVELRVRLPGAGREHRDDSGSLPRRAPLTVGALLVLLPLALVPVFGSQRSAASREGAVQLPPLYRGKQTAVCPQRDATAALGLAERELVAARSAEERAPFAVSDGLLAVELFRRVQACLTLAGQIDRAAAAEASAEELARRLGADFRAHQLALERALEHRRYAEARVQVRALLSYLGVREDGYAEELRMLLRRIDLQLEEGKR